MFPFDWGCLEGIVEPAMKEKARAVETSIGSEERSAACISRKALVFIYENSNGITPLSELKSTKVDCDKDFFEQYSE
jgi:hypothetical protein